MVLDRSRIQRGEYCSLTFLPTQIRLFEMNKPRILLIISGCLKEFSKKGESNDEKTGCKSWFRKVIVWMIISFCIRRSLSSSTKADAIPDEVVSPWV